MIRRLAIIFWILVVCILLLSIYFVYTLIMYYQIIQLSPTLDPDIVQLWQRLWYIESGNTFALLIAIIPITVIIGIYLRVVPPSLDDYAREKSRN